MQPTRAVRPFEVVSEYTPSGDQPTAIADLARRVKAGEPDIVLLGATGTGKSATTAWLIEQVQRPTLVLAHNKTLAAQLANEFRELMPNNAVEYFVSYYDYYQPEAYVPQTDTFIEKDSSVNAEVERLRHSTTNSLLSRRDVIVVSTVSCIYGLGAAEEYLEAMVALQIGQRISRDALDPRLHRDAVPAERHRVHARPLPGPRRHDRDHPGLRGARRPDRDVRRRDRGAVLPPPGDGGGAREARRRLGLPRDALRREPRHDAARDGAPSATSSTTGSAC